MNVLNAVAAVAAVAAADTFARVVSHDGNLRFFARAFCRRCRACRAEGEKGGCFTLRMQMSDSALISDRELGNFNSGGRGREGTISWIGDER